jgi:hypothetical protein
MEFEVSMISTNEYIPEEIVQELIPEKYLYSDDGELMLASILLNSENTVGHLVNFLFPNNQGVNEVYRDERSFILDLTSLKDQFVDFDYLEKNYPAWLETAERNTSMSEYGTLIDFIGFGKKSKNRKHLLLIVSQRLHSS